MNVQPFVRGLAFEPGAGVPYPRADPRDRAGRTYGIDVCNLAYAGAARGEIASAEQIAPVGGVDGISITHGTNCWTRPPHSAGMMEETTAAFLGIVQSAHPGVPIIVATPVLRPDAESTPNKLGATLQDLRAAMRRGAERVAGPTTTIIDGEGLLQPGHLADGIHPGDEGHRVVASTIGSAVASCLTVVP